MDSLFIESLGLDIVIEPLEARERLLSIVVVMETDWRVDGRILGRVSVSVCVCKPV